jgi:hypothetical protein
VAVVARPRCGNCDAEITGKYCAQCGQHYEPHVHSLGHFLTEAAENITHADSRVWLTLWPLLAKPGFLTREFFEGRRARYLPPFRLYLVVSAAFFLLWAVLPEKEHKAVVIDPVGRVVVPIGEEIDRAIGDPAEEHETPEQRAKRICDGAHYTGPGESIISPRVPVACHKIVLDNGRNFLHSYLGNIPRSLFILLPGLAVLMKLMYWRPRRYYVEHLLFFVHNHAAVFLLMALYLLLARGLELLAWPTWPLTMALYVYLFWYSYKSMRRFYGQGKWLTRFKFLLLGTAYFIGATVLLTFIAFFSFMTI